MNSLGYGNWLSSIATHGKNAGMNTTVLTAALIDPDPTAIAAEVSDTALRIVLSDGRELSAPLAWFPRLRDATPDQRRHWELIGRGHGLHWPDVDEDISVRALMGRST